MSLLLFLKKNKKKERKVFNLNENADQSLL